MKQLYNSLRVKEAVEKSDVVFKEIASGIFFTRKDKRGLKRYVYVKTGDVVTVLNDSSLKVVIESSRGTFINFDM